MDKQKVMTAWGDCELVNYSNREEIAKVYSDALFMGNEELGDFGFCYTTADSVVIAFRGSDDYADWLSNIGIDTNSGFFKAIISVLALFKTLITDDGYHVGFHDATGQFINQIVQYVKNSGKQKVELRGHSRGGALVLDIAARLSPHVRIQDAIVFGCPKMCTKDSFLYKEVQRGAITVTQFINGQDIVPRLPFEFPFNKNLARLGNVNTIGKNLTLKQRIKMIRYAMTGQGKWEYFDDHRPKEYTPSLIERYGDK